MMIEEFSHNNKGDISVVITIEEGNLKTIKKRFRGLNVDYLDVIKVANDLGYDISESISDAAYFILSREIEKILVEKLVENQRDVVYIVPKYTPDIKRTVREILRRNEIQADIVVGLLLI